MATGIPGLTASLKLEIGARVYARRTAKGWQQHQLADIAGVRKWAIGLIERGVYLARIDTLFLIADALDCDVAELLPEIEEVLRAYQIAERSVARTPVDQAHPHPPGGGVAGAGPGDAR